MELKSGVVEGRLTWVFCLNEEKIHSENLLLAQSSLACDKLR